MQERNVLSLVVATAWWRGVVIGSVYSDAVGALLQLQLLLLGSVAGEQFASLSDSCRCDIVQRQNRRRRAD